MMDKIRDQEASEDLKWLWVILAVIVSILAFAIYSLYRMDQEERIERVVKDTNYWAYIGQHQCVRTGFAGKHATPTYQCDNGLWLSYEIMQLANPVEQSGSINVK